jgi:SEC-C motif-containing protein
MAIRDCPCHSGRSYAQCCGPLHARQREAATPEALMRSRYAAFALGKGEYLVRTLALGHPDRAQDEGALAHALSQAKQTQRFLGLTIHSTHAAESTGEVVFTARIFERGADRSFTERSRFEREDGAWRYAGGELVDEGWSERPLPEH